MMKDKKRKMAAFLAAVSAAALCLCQAAFAAESAGIEEDRQSVLSIDLEGQDKMATMALYHVGEWDGSQGTYVLTGDFGGASVSFADMMSEEGMSVDDTRAACEALIGYAVANGIQPVDLRTTEGGRLQFAPVDTGIYLVAQVGDSSTFQVSSFLTTLPVLEDGPGFLQPLHRGVHPRGGGFHDRRGAGQLCLRHEEAGGLQAGQHLYDRGEQFL